MIWLQGRQVMGSKGTQVNEITGWLLPVYSMTVLVTQLVILSNYRILHDNIDWTTDTIHRHHWRWQQPTLTRRSLEAGHFSNHTGELEREPCQVGGQNRKTKPGRLALCQEEGAQGHTSPPACGYLVFASFPQPQCRLTGTPCQFLCSLWVPST